MRAPIGWLAEHVELPADVTPQQLADALIRVGMEVERVESGADGLTGPIVVGRVLDFEAEPQKNGKTIRWCRVEVGEADPRGIVCGAANFAPGDLVVVALPGALLPGDFAIAARKTYGHVSDGMICSVRELGVGDDHDGILVLPADSAAPGTDALDVLGLREAVLDVATTTDRGYTLSIRGLAREAAAALGVDFRDVTAAVPALDGAAYPVTIADPDGCDVFAVRTVTGLDPAAPSPEWMARRLRQCGMRSVSLAVDVTNYVMLETGQPLHAFDRARLAGALVARRATAGETITTLDGQARALDVGDMVVADDSGAVAIGGVMGGASTEIGPASTDVVLEAAHWNPASVSRTVRRQRLPSEAARRFERDVDPLIGAVALGRAVELLVEHGGASAAPGFTAVGTPAAAATIALPVGLSERVAGFSIARDEVLSGLTAVGCRVTDPAADPLLVTPPSWRPDLLLPADLVEETVRLAGYERIPSVLPRAAAGRGLTGRQALLRRVSRAVAAAGGVEVLSLPFVSPATWDEFGLAADDSRRRAARLANPLSEDEPLLRTTLLPGLVQTARRNLGRGLRDLVITETGLVFLPRVGVTPPELPGVAARPTNEQIAELDALLPDQPRHLGVLLCGTLTRAGWWGPARPADWADAVEFAQLAARAAGTTLLTAAADHAPWHPGRCAALRLAADGPHGAVVGHAGELHPRVVAALGLPERSCAVELDLDALPVPGPVSAPVLSGFPPVLLDVALVVTDDVPAAAVLHTLRGAAGDLLEDVTLFDVYVSAERLGAGRRSLAFALRFRAPDRTLTIEEATVARDVAVSAAAERFGAELRR